MMLYLLAIVHLADFDSKVPDRIEYKHSYVHLQDCWDAANEIVEAMPQEEAIVVCLSEEF